MLKNELKEDELEKVNGGFSINGDGTYSLTNGDNFVTAPQGDRTVYVVQGDYPNAILDCAFEFYFMEFSNDVMVNEGTTILTLRQLFDKCNITY